MNELWSPMVCATFNLYWVNNNNDAVAIMLLLFKINFNNIEIHINCDSLTQAVFGIIQSSIEWSLWIIYAAQM